MTGKVRDDLAGAIRMWIPPGASGMAAAAGAKLQQEWTLFIDKGPGRPLEIKTEWRDVPWIQGEK